MTSVHEVFPDAILIYDLHVVKLFNGLINQLRRRIYREIKNKTARNELVQTLI